MSVSLDDQYPYVYCTFCNQQLVDAAASKTHRCKTKSAWAGEFDPEENRKRQLSAALEQVIRKTFHQVWPSSTGSSRFFNAMTEAVFDFVDYHISHLTRQLQFHEKQRLKELQLMVNPPLVMVDKDKMQNVGDLLDAAEFRKQMKHIIGPFYIRRKA